MIKLSKGMITKVIDGLLESNMSMFPFPIPKERECAPSDELLLSTNRE